MRIGTAKKYKAIQDRYKQLYETQRLRIDDCIEQLMKEFFIEHQDTVWRILRTEVKEQDMTKVDPDQVSMFSVDGFLPEELKSAM